MGSYMSKPCSLAELRRHIEKLEGSRHDAGALPFGVAEIDARLPGGGLTLGALHEIAGGGDDAIDGASAALFAAGIAARAEGPVLWCATESDLFAPGLARTDLTPGRMIHVAAKDEKSLLACCEEALRHGSLGAVVADLSRLSMLASRRLQLAAEETGTLALAVRRWKGKKQAADYGDPTAAVTRWRVTALPSAPLPVPGIGRPRWRLELMRCKSGNPAEFDVEVHDGAACLTLVAPLADRPAAPTTGSQPKIWRAAS